MLALWTWREPALTTLGGLRVEETPPAPADLVVVFDHDVPGAAAAADLVANGDAPRLLLFKAPPAADETLLDRLNLPVPTHQSLAILVLQRLGVAAEAIVVEPVVAPATEVDRSVAVQATARYAQRHDATRVIVITSRSHTRRAALLLRRALGRSAVVIVWASPDDPFHPEGSWRDRSNSREVIMESVRWGLCQTARSIRILGNVLDGDSWC